MASYYCTTVLLRSKHPAAFRPKGLEYVRIPPKGRAGGIDLHRACVYAKADVEETRKTEKEKRVRTNKDP